VGSSSEGGVEELEVDDGVVVSRDLKCVATESVTFSANV
jgi:hypothetical protein